MLFSLKGYTVTRRTQIDEIVKIDANRYQSIKINRLILEIDEQSMKEDSVTFKQ